MSETDHPLDSAHTARRCPMCGETVVELPHSGCLGLFKEVMKDPPSTRSSIDDMPAEVEELSSDPTRKLNQYILVSQIGRGGMGIVWKAWDTKLTRWAAIKFLSAQEPSDVLRFEREAKLAARLRHPNIAAIYEVGESVAPVPGNPVQRYLAMEFIDGDPLSKIEELPIREWLQVFVQVGRAVDTAHKAGVVHRDLKPHNIMLTKEQWPYVMDFGLAKSLRTDTSLSASGAVMGTPSYMPPEQAQARHEEVDERSDTYSLGATLYSVLCKTFPFDGQSAIEVLGKVCNQDPRPPRELNPEIPEEIEAVLLKAMAKDKADRYPSAGELADDLQLFLSAGEVAAVPPSPFKRTFRKIRRSPVAYLVLLAAAATAGFFIFRPPAVTPPPAPPPSLTAEQKRIPVEGTLTRLENERRFRSALDELQKNKDLFPGELHANREFRIREACRRHFAERIPRFQLNLNAITSVGHLRALSDEEFDSLFSFPPREELVETNDVCDWARDTAGPALRALRDDPEARGMDLFGLAESAVSLEEEARNPWFLAVEAIAFDDLRDELEALVKEVERERAGKRRKKLVRKDFLKDTWRTFLSSLKPDFRLRHDVLGEHDGVIGTLVGRWPEPVPASSYEPAAREALERGDPAALADARDRLRELADPTNSVVSAESKQELYTWILILEVHRRVVLGDGPEQGIELGRELTTLPASLRELGGPTDRFRAHGPVVEGVFRKLFP